MIHRDDLVQLIASIQLFLSLLSGNQNPIRQEIVALIRSKGEKAHGHDANGKRVGYGNGDLND